MSTIQEQKKKQLTFEEICPEWSQAIQYYRKQDWTGELGKLNIASHKCCIIGEAHGFDRNYIFRDRPEYCKDCDDFAILFCSERDFNEHKQDFVDHWNEVHLNK